MFTKQKYVQFQNDESAETSTDITENITEKNPVLASKPVYETVIQVGVSSNKTTVVNLNSLVNPDIVEEKKHRIKAFMWGIILAVIIESLTVFIIVNHYKNS